MECAALQEQECDALEAILEPGEIVVASNSEAKGDPTQTRPPHRHVQIETSMELQGAPRDVWVYPGPTRILLSHLPPIQLRATLPPGYPLEKPPEVQLRSSWEISESWLENLEQELQSKWAQDACLFDMMDHLKSFSLPSQGAIALFPTRERHHRLGTTTPTVAVPAVNLPFIAQLKRYNKERSTQRFSGETFDCGICLDTLKGVGCLQIRQCAHVFCAPCLTDYFNMCITEGTVGNVHCPDLECSAARVKAVAAAEAAEAAADENAGDEVAHHSRMNLPGDIDLEELKEIVGPDQAQRFVTLKRKQILEADPSAIACPRLPCQAPVLRNPNEAYAKLRECQECGFNFCAFCRRTYHGPTDCELRSEPNAAVVLRYLEANEVDQKMLRRQYGAAALLKMVAKHEEDEKNTAWLKENTTSCPMCKSATEKSEGCNKMVCGKCHAKFCYRCGAHLDYAHPYDHFNDRTSPCFSRLFDLPLDLRADLDPWNDFLVGALPGW